MIARLAPLVVCLALGACARDLLETGPDGSACIDPASLSHRQYAQDWFVRNETSVKISFSLPGYTSHEARLSSAPYQADAVAQAVRKYAAAHPKAVTQAAGGLKKVEAWPDPVRSTPQSPVLVSAPARGWYLVEPALLEQDGDDAFLVECPASAKGAECIRHRAMAGMSVEIGITAADLQQWPAADPALRTTLFSLLSACMP